MDGLTIGRMVHFVNDEHGGHDPMKLEHYAAIVTAVLDAATGKVNLVLFTPWGDMQPRRAIPFRADGSVADTWHWIEKA